MVIKSNKLIGMQTKLSLIQMKIFALLVAKTLESPETEYYRFSTKELMRSCNFWESNYTALQQTTAGMIKPVIFKWQEEQKQKQYPLLDGVVHDRGTVDISIHRLVKPFILDVASKYTKYYFENISFLNSTHSIRLYELLKEFEFRWSRYFTIEDFRFLLNIQDWAYNRPYDLKTKIIEKAQKEIKKKTDISFTYEEKKEGRRLIGFSFNIQAKIKEAKNIITSNSLDSSIEQTLKTKLLLNDTQIKTVLKQYETDYIQRNIDYTLSQRSIKNIPWYFLKALEKDFWQTLFMQKKIKAKEKKISDEKLKNDEELKQQEQLKKAKLEKFIEDRGDELKELLPEFIEANRFMLERLGLDVEDENRLLSLIR